MNKLHLITKNIGKLKAARSVFDQYSIELDQIVSDIHEIQANTSLEVAKYTAVNVASSENIHVIREDHSIMFNALKIPGVFSSYFNKRVDNAILLKMLSSFEDRTGYFEIATVYSSPMKQTIELSYKVNFHLLSEERGNLQKGINQLIVLEGEKRTLAEYPEEERLHVWNKNFHAIANEIISKHDLYFRD